MKLLDLNWIGPKVDRFRAAYYEKAYAKAALEGQSNDLSYKTFESMFGEPPKKGIPYWLVRLCVYYGSLTLGHKRLGTKMNSLDERFFYCLLKQDEAKLKSDRVLMHYMYLHDVEDAKFDGRELVS